MQYARRGEWGWCMCRAGYVMNLKTLHGEGFVFDGRLLVIVVLGLGILHQRGEVALELEVRLV